jgi:outer membrane murein-binding lipoprotein Lpp
LVAATIMLAGCANIQNDRTRTKVEGTTAGAAAGGILGGVIGGIASLGSPSYIAQGAIIGAQLGGHGGYAYGTSVANKKAQYASREAWLDACIAEAKATGEKSRNYSELARRVIARQRLEIAGVLKDGEIRPESRARAAAIRAELDANITNLSGAIRTWDSVLEAHREVVRRNQGRPQGEALNQQVDELNASQDALRQDLDSFHAMRKNLGP